jgi:hypothetical protein
MTSQSPRIYLYKITFEEVPYYYYGVHKERKYNEYYMGTPVTHKWCWNFYTPEKQILQVFDYTDEGYLEAQEVEKRLIKPVFNNDKWCLNENVGGLISLNIRRKTGQKVGKKLYELKNGLFGRTTEKITKDSKKSGTIGGKKTYEMKLGIHSLSKEKILENAKNGGKLGGKISSELKLGVHARSKEKIIEDGRKGAEIINAQKWECCITGYVSTAAGVVSYQKGKGIDTSKSNRRRIT